MRGFHVLLPTFATDYSGVCSALYELGGLVIILGPSGCANNVIAHDEPRRTQLPSRVFGADLDDLEATFGPDERIVEDACETWRRVGGAFVAVVGTPASMVIGTDHQALAREIGRRCGIPAIAFSTSGTSPYPTGVAQALLEVARTLVWPEKSLRETLRLGHLPGSEDSTSSAATSASGAPMPSAMPATATSRMTAHRGVNLLGATPLDLSDQATANDAQAALEADGWHVVSCWCMGSSLEELREGSSAQANIVLTASSLPLARWMLDELGIPYVWGLFSGEQATEDTLAHLERVITGNASDPVPFHATLGTRPCLTDSRKDAAPANDGPSAGACDASAGHSTEAAVTSSPAPVHPEHPEGHPESRTLVVADLVLAESLRRAIELGEAPTRVDVAVPFPTKEPPLRPDDRIDVDERALMGLIRSGTYGLVVGDPSLAYLVADPATCQTRFLPVSCIGISGRLPHPDAVRPYEPDFSYALTSRTYLARDLIADDPR